MSDIFVSGCGAMTSQSKKIGFAKTKKAARGANLLVSDIPLFLCHMIYAFNLTYLL